MEYDVVIGLTDLRFLESRSGHSLNCSNLRTRERNGSRVLRVQGFVSGLKSFSSELDRDPWSMMLLLLGQDRQGYRWR
nr:hypothetical protein CFP56_29634 [Quercus suber]